uniref:Uncharacterized protein n=1 Tax=Chromera velia CCMP2878 TaxID=1169474 RepID=A0A0G4FF37_9ALVE|eukprot:Cvel_16628.t1-p1 / transcript=Cvel_16628.t1 / gene=Cvel_16628 / organism=Chromera_velia_CCMP2878 / gene_product=hypothetical protein / transcript_product=hypothetical protein / location=Cvel_scaffold1289:13691-15820(+) / protein_length=472 / sequence_SO=supercontig / SO=protein_coding / is_pseudo=false
MPTETDTRKGRPTEIRKRKGKPTKSEKKSPAPPRSWREATLAAPVHERSLPPSLEKVRQKANALASHPPPISPPRTKALEGSPRPLKPASLPPSTDRVMAALRMDPPSRARKQNTSGDAAAACDSAEGGGGSGGQKDGSGEENTGDDNTNRKEGTDTPPLQPNWVDNSVKGKNEGGRREEHSKGGAVGASEGGAAGGASRFRILDVQQESALIVPGFGLFDLFDPLGQHSQRLLELEKSVCQRLGIRSECSVTNRSRQNTWGNTEFSSVALRWQWTDAEGEERWEKREVQMIAGGPRQAHAKAAGEMLVDSGLVDVAALRHWRQAVRVVQFAEEQEVQRAYEGAKELLTDPTCTCGVWRLFLPRGFRLLLARGDKIKREDLKEDPALNLGLLQTLKKVCEGKSVNTKGLGGPLIGGSGGRSRVPMSMPVDLWDSLLDECTLALGGGYMEGSVEEVLRMLSDWIAPRSGPRRH